MILKQTPSDFLVREHLIPRLSEGAHTLYLLRKEDWNTEDCLQWICEHCHIQRKNIGVCGNKDKQAITEQYISIKNGPAHIRTPHTFSLTALGKISDQIRLGNHERNFFTITLRECTQVEPPTFKPCKNYFGVQRFGENNVQIGFALLRKDYKQAATLLNIPFTTDPIGAIRKVPKHTLLLFIHSVQSQIWNEVAEQLDPVQDDIPIMGFAPGGNMKHMAIVEQIMQKYNLTRDSFINRSFPELTSEGGSRPLLQDVQDFSVSKIENKTCTVCFSLGKGSYATETIRQLFDNQ